ncbi:MAG: thioredoxin family protein [Rubrivivax sp.]|nr:MAG: thioredoxin family protein [Rubrivivax sp.]
MLMRRQFSKTLLACAVLAGVPVVAMAAADVNQTAPAFSAQGAHGKTINLSDYQGKTVVLEWTNQDCPFVKKHYDSGNIQKLQKEAAAKGVVWLQVISSAPGEQGQVDGPTAIKANEYRSATPAGIVLDPQGKVGKLYGAQTTPHLFIIDPQGKLAYKGGIDSIASTKQEDIAKAEPYVSNAIKAVTSGQKVAQPSTRPYGCSVKYAS